MAIKIPSYRSLVKNEVFVRETVYNAGGVAVPMEEILVLNKFITPTAEDLANYLQKKTEEVELLLASKIEPQMSLLEKVLAGLSAEVKSDLMKKDEELMQFIQEGYTLPHFIAAGQDYLFQIHCGQFLPEMYQQLKKEGRLKDKRWYRTEAFSLAYIVELPQGKTIQRPVEQWEVLLHLNKGQLPDRKTVDFLLSEGAVQSDKLMIGHNNGELYFSYPKEEIRDTIGLIYSSLADTTEISDISQELKEDLALLIATSINQASNAIQFIPDFSAASEENDDEIEEMLGQKPKKPDDGKNGLN